jgi:hypothetical protein
MKPDIVLFMEKARRCRAGDMQLQALQKRVELLVNVLEAHTMSYTPRIIDLYNIDSFRKALDHPLGDGKDTVSASSFDKAISDWDSVLAEARSHRVKSLVDALRSWRKHASSTDFATDDPTKADLELATSVFICVSPWRNGCTHVRTLRTEEMLAHRCIHMGPARSGIREWTERDRRRLLEHVSLVVKGAGGCGDVRVDPEPSRKAAGVVRLAGLDPRCTTSAEMDARDPWFTCNCASCEEHATQRNGHRRVYRWRHAARSPPLCTLAYPLTKCCRLHIMRLWRT